MKRPTIKELAQSVGASQNTLYRWQREEGVDIKDPVAVRRRAAMMPPKDEQEADKPFGRKLRDVLEDMPLGLIDEIESAGDRHGKLWPLCRWVECALLELAKHPDRPDGLLLSEVEAEDARRFREQMRGQRE